MIELLPCGRGVGTRQLHQELFCVEFNESTLQ